MAQGYQPYPIYDYDSGLVLERAPWLIPNKAFSEIMNFYVRNGVLQKRRGYSLFTEMVHQVRDEKVGEGDGVSPSFAFTATNLPLRRSESSAAFQIVADFQTLTEDVYDAQTNTSTLKGDGTGTVDWTEGLVSITFNTVPEIAVDILMDYEYKPGLPITGIYSFWSGIGDEQLLIFNTKRINVYSPISGLTRDVTEADVFSAGGPLDYVHMEVWTGAGYISNGKDPIKKFDGSTVTNLPTDLTGNSVNNISACHIIISYKSRLVLLGPVEDGTVWPQRARWSAPGTDSNFIGGGYIDAPALDWIVGADFIGDRLIVFFERSVWSLNYMGDVDMPFVWEKLIDTEGCAAPMSTAAFANEIFLLGPVEFIACDGITTDKLDLSIPDYPLKFDQELYDKVYGAVLEEENQVFWNYPEIGDPYPTSQLVFNYKNDSWTKFDIPIQVVGYYRQQMDYSWEQIDIPWQDIDWSWAEKEAQSGYPTTLGGMQDGKVVVLNQTAHDMGAVIHAHFITKALNPFVESSRSVRLGYIDIYYNVDPVMELKVSVYEYDSTNPYFEETINLTGREGITKDFQRIAINGTAKFHKIKLTHSQDIGPVKIHAVVPWMKPAGRLWGG